MRQGAFSVRFAPYGVNHWKLFAPDVMHEFELGVWKAIFTHLIRMVIDLGGNAIQALDRRYVRLRCQMCEGSPLEQGMEWSQRLDISLFAPSG